MARSRLPRGDARNGTEGAAQRVPLYGSGWVWIFAMVGAVPRPYAGRGVFAWHYCGGEVSGEQPDNSKRLAKMSFAPEWVLQLSSGKEVRFKAFANIIPEDCLIVRCYVTENYGVVNWRGSEEYVSRPTVHVVLQHSSFEPVHEGMEIPELPHTFFSRIAP